MKHSIIITAIICIGLSASILRGAVIGQLGVLEDTANGGINPVTGSAWAAGDTYRLVFVTSQNTFTASSSVMQDYHDAVTAAANTAGLGGNWFAIGTTTGTNGRTNTNTTASLGAGIFLTDGTSMVADSYDGFWDSQPNNSAPSLALNNPINHDENGVLQTTNNQVWTGMNADGTELGDGRELGGTDPNTILGVYTQTNSAWARQGNAPKVDEKRLYAMSDVLAVIPEPSVALLAGTGVILLLNRRR